MADPLAIEAERKTAGVRRDSIEIVNAGGYARHHSSQRHHIAAVGGEIQDLGSGNHRADLARVRLDEGYQPALNSDTLLGLAHLKRDVNARAVPDVYDNALSFKCFEA